ncbi:MAG TPA: SpoIIE family protein phosphatase, partial [Casimicrobiaceae bacterium]|nr:SpoIIE family protein phosphatase [Casimicrobiaceae bacterium]
MPELIWVIEGERLVFANRAFHEYVGLDVGTGGAEREAFIHPDDREALSLALSQRVTEQEFRIRRASDGMFRWHLMRWQHVDAADGSPLYRVGTAIDVHDRHTNTDQQEFLSESSRTINASLDLEKTLRAIVRRAIPFLADWAEIDLFARNGLVTRAIAHQDSAIEESLRQLVGRSQDANPTAQYERLEAAMRDRRSVLTRHFLEEMIDAVVLDPAARAIYHNAQTASNAIVPLVSRDRVLGSLLVARRAADRAYTEEDLPLIEEYARRAALAIDNAQIFGREHRVADVMQSSSLPRKLPKIPTVEMHAIYVPGQSEAQIGGDWYDAFRLRDGRLVISVGDVVGSGVEAAVTMGNMRQIIRGTAQLHADPVLMLDAADSALRLEESDRYVTACVAVIDPVSRTMTYASAGHPPPYLRTTEHGLVALTYDDLPLGLRQRGGRHPAMLQLAPGAMLVFYTDGLIESTHDVLGGIADLETLLSSREFLRA